MKELQNQVRRASQMDWRSRHGESLKELGHESERGVSIRIFGIRLVNRRNDDTKRLVAEVVRRLAATFPVPSTYTRLHE